MPTSTSPPNVVAAAALQFSVDGDPRRADTQPTVLLLTQNVGGIEASYCGPVPSPPLPSAPASDLRSSAAALPAMIASLATPSYLYTTNDTETGSTAISPAVRQQVEDFLSDLRTWLHRMCYASAAARAAELGTTPGLTASGAASPHEHPPASSSSSAAAAPNGQPPTAGSVQSAETYLRAYTPSARPPLVDLVAIHFQEIGGKYKNKAFNRYFREQVGKVLLPEAGWCSGLLMDERESEHPVVSSSTCRRPMRQRGSPAMRNYPTTAGGIGGTLDSTGGGSELSGGDARRSNEASGTETDPGDEEPADLFFTAMGTIVFLAPRVLPIASCLSVPHRTYIPVVDDPITYAGDAGRLFHSGKFAEAGRSRKGFLLVSLRLGTVQLNLCNVHLFNDDDNRVALEQSPSLYVGRRVRAMQEAVSECSAVIDLAEPLFLLGDYNVRLDGQIFVRWAEEVEHITIRAGKKQLRCPEHLWDFFSDAARLAELRAHFDREPSRLMDELATQAKLELGEMPVFFPPTYSRIPYRARGGEVGTSGGAKKGSKATSRSTSSALLSDSAGAQAGGTGSSSRNTPLPLSGTVSPPPPPLGSVNGASAVTEPLTRITATEGRGNFCRERLPAWCDRVLFNVAGLEWIAGDRARAASPISGTVAPSSAVATSGGREKRRMETPHAASQRWYLYESIDFAHMDHDGVYLLF